MQYRIKKKKVTILNNKKCVIGHSHYEVMPTIHLLLGTLHSSSGEKKERKSSQL
jgi:hypothetical protein